jgi:hypothetical protein
MLNAIAATEAAARRTNPLDPMFRSHLFIGPETRALYAGWQYLCRAFPLFPRAPFDSVRLNENR